MRTYWAGEAACRGLLVHYCLLEEKAGDAYGICVECGGEQAVIRELSVSREQVCILLKAMIRGCVTPATARDVAEDWLLR